MAATSAGLSATVKTMYEKRLLDRALPRIVHGKFGTIARMNGYGTYELRKWNSLSGVISSTLSEGVTPSESAAPTITTVTITPAWYGSWISYTDILDMISFDPAVSEIVAILSEQAGLSFDTLVRNTITDGATKLYSGVATSRGALSKSTDKVSYKDFVHAIATLELNNAQSAGAMIPVIMGPLSFAELMNDATFVALFTRTGGEQMYQYKMGTILNAEIYVTSNVRTYVDEGAAGGVSGNCDPASMLFIGKGAYGLAGIQNAAVDYVQDSGGEHANNTGKSIRPVEIIMKGLGEVGNDPLNQRGSIGWKASHAATILNASWIVDLEHVHSWS